MARWLDPSSGTGRIVAQVVLLVVAAALVYAVVMWLGSGLGGRTPL